MSGYTVIRSRRRTLALQVTKDCRVVVRAPLYAAGDDIDRFVAEKAEFAYLYRNEPELNRCTEKPFYENNGFQFRIYAFAGSGNNGQGSGRRFV